MKIVMLIGDAANQRALAYRLSEVVEIDAIAAIGKAKYNNNQSRRSLLNAIAGFPFSYAWRKLMRKYSREYPNYPDCEVRYFDSVKSEELIDFIREWRPDLAVVSGTSLLKEEIIEEIRSTGSIMNLHTGISPYVKGGPNCTNWCLSAGQFQHIGNTIMWLDIGIDTGNIIKAERTPLSGSESLYELHEKVMDHAHYMYVDQVKSFAFGENLPSISQSSIAEGRTYFRREWVWRAKFRALVNFYLRYRSSL